MKKVCAVGSATQDMFIQYEGADTMHLHTLHSDCSYLMIPQGSKIDIPHVHYSLGGGATNIAVGLKKMGFEVEAIFRTGNDPAGQYIRECLIHEEITIDHCTIDPEHGTAISFIIPSLEHDHAAFCYRAANRHQRIEDFPLDLLKNLDFLYLGPLGGDSQKLLPHLAHQASIEGVTVAVNPSMGQLTQNTEELRKALQSCNILLLNTLESAYLMQALLHEKNTPILCCMPTKEPSLLQEFLTFNATNLSFSLYHMAQYFLESGPQTIVITNGIEGVYVITPHMIYFHPSIPANPVYSLGAGDAFASGFIGALNLEIPVEEALTYGIINASSVIQHPDAKQGLLSFELLQEKVQKLGSALLKTYALRK